MRNKILLSIIVMVILLGTISLANAGVANLSSEIGSSYIMWNWNYNNNTTSTGIYIDGNFQHNTTLKTYTLSDLESREQHDITLINTTNESEIFATNSVKTFYPPFLFYLVFIVALSLLLVELFIKEFIVTVTTGTLSFVMSILGFHLSFPYHFTIFTYLCLAIGVVALLWVLLAVFSSLTQQADIMEW